MILLPCVFTQHCRQLKENPTCYLLYVETMYVYTLKYVYIYRTYVYMYLYVNKESLLNLALACGLFDFWF